MMNYYREGYQAYIMGLWPDDNPYPVGSQGEFEWSIGWDDACMAGERKAIKVTK